MRKITEAAVKAFLANKSFKKDNTRVARSIAGTRMYLHGNLIASKTAAGKLRISDGNYRDIHGSVSATTRERLNGLGKHYNFGVFNRDRVTYLATSYEVKEMEYGENYLIKEDY